MGQLALISLGANVTSPWGDPAVTVQKAMLALHKTASAKPVVSDLYATAAFPAGSGPDFVNAVVALQTDLAPLGLLAALHSIEAEAGRARVERWGQRTLDLDMLALGDAVLPDLNTFSWWRDMPLEQQLQVAPKELILPHPRLQERGFVLVPLAQIAPDWTHPVLGQTAAKLCAGLPAEQRADVRRIGPPVLTPQIP